MKILKRNEFEELANIKGEYCVSIYIPTNRKGVDVTQGKDALAFKNQLQTVKNKLSDNGVPDRDIYEMLKQPQSLHDDYSFWRHQLDGLAVFFNEQGFFRYYRVPVEFEEFCCITNSFHLLQLVPLLNEDELFYILSFGKNKIRLMEANRFMYHEVDLGERVQQDLMDVLKYYDFESGIYHKNSAQGGGWMGSSGATGGGSVNPSGVRGGASFHGMGDNRSDREHHLLFEFFRNVNEGLSNIIKDQKIPIVLAGVDYLHPTFKEAANGYTFNIVEKGIDKNPDSLSEQELHEKSVEILDDYLHKGENISKTAYGNLAGTGKTTYDIDQIIPAAVNGRVDSLFIAKGAEHVWGRFDDKTQTVEVHNEYTQGDDDLVDKSAVQTILHGGNAFIVDQSEMPDRSVKRDVVAVLRY